MWFHITVNFFEDGFNKILFSNVCNDAIANKISTLFVQEWD